MTASTKHWVHFGACSGDTFVVPRAGKAYDARLRGPNPKFRATTEKRRSFMAEKENIEYAKQQIAALNARDLDGYVSRIDDSYVGQSETAPGPIRGREGVRQHLETLFKAFPDLRIEIEQIIASGDSLVVRTSATGTHKGSFAGVAPTNKSIVLQGCNVLEIRNGKAIKGRLYADNATLFQQLGALSLHKATVAS
jgi:steroid delta-isomerase-like uncharacterized protein